MVKVEAKKQIVKNETGQVMTVDYERINKLIAELHKYHKDYTSMELVSAMEIVKHQLMFKSAQADMAKDAGQHSAKLLQRMFGLTEEDKQ